MPNSPGNVQCRPSPALFEETGGEFVHAFIFEDGQPYDFEDGQAKQFD